MAVFTVHICTKTRIWYYFVLWQNFTFLQCPDNNIDCKAMAAYAPQPKISVELYWYLLAFNNFLLQLLEKKARPQQDKILDILVVGGPYIL